MKNVVGMASVASKWRNSAFEQDQNCRRVLGEEERGVHILLRCHSGFPFHQRRLIKCQRETLYLSNSTEFYTQSRMKIGLNIPSLPNKFTSQNSIS